MTHISKSPCKGCEERSLKCHGTCEKYLEYQRDAEAIRQKRREYTKAQDEYISQVERRAKMRGKVSYGKSTKRSGLS